MIAALSAVNPYWIEEPVLSDDFAAQQRLRAEFPNIRMAWGENAFRLAHFQQVTEQGLADVIMPDPCRCGGMGAAMDAARAVGAHGLAVSAHHYGSDLGFAAMLHFMAATPLTDMVLRDIALVALRDTIVAESLVPVNGPARLLKGPGFGVTPDLDVIVANRVTL
jgi:L-alanine-DL-glutamate epimerase-like enolase superfamily enzyme